MDYNEFISNKSQEGIKCGFEPVFMPDILFDFQKELTQWAIRKGRGAIFADCGLGKTFMQLVWAENIVRKTNKRVLILTPLSVSFQTVLEAEKLGIEAKQRREGIKYKDKIVITNYERLHYFDKNDFIAVVCDESSILKNFNGETRTAVTEFMRKMPYRLLCTATAAPNDYIELGTSSEALGYMGYTDMLSRFFKRDSAFCRVSNRAGQGWIMKKYAEKDFWRWVCSWARALRKPSDMGFNDDKFKLPKLITKEHIVKAETPTPGMLFNMPVVSLQEQKEELRRTLNERCEKAAETINNKDSSAVAWCHLNYESNLLKKLIDDSVEVIGSDTDEKKEEAFKSFAKGEIKAMVTKPTIAGFGLNWQHCNIQTFFPSHSYEQYYQAIRRCWRFGQKNDVEVNLIFTSGQRKVLDNLKRKSKNADDMFSMLVKMMYKGLEIKRSNDYVNEMEVPEWL